MSVPGSDSRNTTNISLPGTPGGRGMLFQENVAAGATEVVVVKAGGTGVTSVVPTGSASRVASRPLAEPVLSVWLKFGIVNTVGKTDGDGMGVGKGDGDGEGVGAAATVPKATGPVT